MTGTSWPGAGLPQERLALIAARKAFVEMKHTMMAAVALLDDDARGAWLRRQARLAQAPEDLWWLEPQVRAAADGDAACAVAVRLMLSALPAPMRWTSAATARPASAPAAVAPPQQSRSSDGSARRSDASAAESSRRKAKSANSNPGPTVAAQ